METYLSILILFWAPANSASKTTTCKLAPPPSCFLFWLLLGLPLLPTTHGTYSFGIGSSAQSLQAQSNVAPPSADLRLYDIAGGANAERIKKDVTRLVGFGTRHTLSDTTSATRGIGAARRWIFDEFNRIGAACGGCLEVFYQRNLVEGDPESRIREDTWVVNVVAILRGGQDPNRIIMMSGDIDSRVSDPLDGVSDSPRRKR